MRWSHTVIVIVVVIIDLLLFTTWLNLPDPYSYGWIDNYWISISLSVSFYLLTYLTSTKTLRKILNYIEASFIIWGNIVWILPLIWTLFGRGPLWNWFAIDLHLLNKQTCIYIYREMMSLKVPSGHLERERELRGATAVDEIVKGTEMAATSERWGM